MKFVYVFDEETRNKLLAMGFKEVNSGLNVVGEGKTLYAFENKPEEGALFFESMNYVLSDILAF